MRTPRRAARSLATVLLAGCTLFTGTTALADHLNYTEPTQFEVDHPEVNAEAPAPAAEAEAPAEDAGGGGIPAGLADAFAALRFCESSGDYGANTGNGYYGAYQFSLTTWQWLGYSGYPHLASPAVQDEAAVALYNIYGWSPWPACSRSLGLA